MLQPLKLWKMAAGSEHRLQKKGRRWGEEEGEKGEQEGVEGSQGQEVH